MKDEEMRKIKNMNLRMLLKPDLVVLKSLEGALKNPIDLSGNKPLDTYTVKAGNLWKDFYEIVQVDLSLHEHTTDDERAYLYKNALYKISERLSESLDIYEDSNETMFGENIKYKTYYCKLKPSELHLLILAALGIDKARDEVIDWLRG